MGERRGYVCPVCRGVTVKKVSRWEEALLWATAAVVCAWIAWAFWRPSWFGVAGFAGLAAEASAIPRRVCVMCGARMGRGAKGRRAARA